MTAPDLSRFTAAVRFRDRATTVAVAHHERAGLAPSRTYARATFDAIEQMIREDERKKLAAAGRLVPPDTDTRIEYALKATWDTGEVQFWESDRATAEIRIEVHAQRRAEGPYRIVSSEVVQREVITSVGPWLPVPTAPDGTS